MIPSIDPKLIFEVCSDEFGRFSARCLNARITTAGSSLGELQENLTAAIAAHFPDEEPPDAGAVHLLFAAEDAPSL
ncbi:MAG: hypothetical protein ACLFU2_10415 [Opitutales bacterium]